MKEMVCAHAHSFEFVCVCAVWECIVLLTLN